MPAALELIILPTVLLTVVGVILAKTSLALAGVIATLVFVGLLYFTIVMLLRQMRRWEREH